MITPGGWIAMALKIMPAWLYPDHAALKLFRVFNLCSTGNYKEAATEMMKLAVETGTHASLAEYKRAIADYIDDIAKPS